LSPTKRSLQISGWLTASGRSFAALGIAQGTSAPHLLSARSPAEHERSVLRFSLGLTTNDWTILQLSLEFELPRGIRLSMMVYLAPFYGVTTFVFRLVGTARRGREELGLNL
jgi:hypothetical protein